MFALWKSCVRVAADYQQAFLQEIMEGDDPQVASLIFADWLEERGDPMSEWLRRLVEGEDVVPVKVYESELVEEPAGQYEDSDYDYAPVDEYDITWDLDKLREVSMFFEASDSPVRPGLSWYTEHEELYGGDSYNPYQNEGAVEKETSYHLKHPYLEGQDLGEFYGKILYKLAGVM